MQTTKAAGLKPKHFRWTLGEDQVATITFDRSERKNPLTFESYAELRDTFHLLAQVDASARGGGEEDQQQHGVGVVYHRSVVALYVVVHAGQVKCCPGLRLSAKIVLST